MIENQNDWINLLDVKLLDFCLSSSKEIDQDKGKVNW